MHAAPAAHSRELSDFFLIFVRVEAAVLAGKAAPHPLCGFIKAVIVMLAGKIPHTLPFLAHRWSRSAFPVLIQMRRMLHPDCSFLRHIIHLLTGNSDLEGASTRLKHAIDSPRGRFQQTRASEQDSGAETRTPLRSPCIQRHATLSFAAPPLAPPAWGSHLAKKFKCGQQNIKYPFFQSFCSPFQKNFI